MAHLAKMNLGATRDTLARRSFALCPVGDISVSVMGE